MNSLEFINLEIAITKTKLKEHNKFSQTQLAIKDEKRLRQLIQIKTELEAWEVVKDNVNVYSHQGCNNVEIEYVQITEEQLPDYKHVDIIKKAKALEVGNE